jgi:endo-1,4-beta-xylanase
MKKFAWALIALVAVVGLFIGCGPDPLEGITTKTMRIPQGTPTVDGEKDALYKMDPVVIDTVNWDKNPDVPGATGTATCLWDDGFIYVYAEIKDASWDDNLRAGPYDRDTMELYIDENYSHGENYDSDDAQYRINSENVITGWGAYNPDAAKGVFKKTDTGYTVEFALPFQFEMPVANQLVGLDFQLNDAKGKGFRESTIAWNQDDDSAWSRSSKFGTALLLK